MQGHFLVLCTNKVIYNVRARSISTRIAEPFVAGNTSGYRIDGVNPAVSKSTIMRRQESFKQLHYRRGFNKMADLLAYRRVQVIPSQEWTDLEKSLARQHQR
jgi:hypothetical protein